MNTRKVNSISRALALRINAQRARNIAVGAALVMVPLCSDGQAQPGPGVQWRTVSWADELPETGVLNALQSIDYNTNPCYPQDIVGVHYTQTASQGQSVTQDNSSEDWWYAHVNCYAPGTSTFIGIATVGYSHILNWSDDGDPCFNFPLDEDLVSPRRRELFETWAYQTGGPPFCTVAFFDPQGVMLWCKVVMPGTFYALCQDPVDGSIIAVGDAAANRTVDALQGHVSPTIHYNPTGNSTDVDISQVTCGAYGTWASKTAVAKFDLQGSMQWLNTYGADVGVSDAWIFKSRGLAVAPLTIDGGHGYLVSGWCNTPGSGDIGHLIRIKADGSVKDQHQVVSGDVPDLGLQSGDLLWLRAIDVVNNGADGIVLTGGHLHGDYWDSYLMTMAPAAYNFQMVAYTRETLSANNMTVVHHTDQHQFSTSAKFTNESGGVHNILWPVLSNYAQGTGIGAGIKHATLIMYKFPNGLHTTPLWSTDLGEVEAYDLQADVVQLADGLSCAVLGTRYSKPYSITNKFMRSSLSTSANACLQQFTLDGDPDPNGADINVPCDNADQEDHLDWNGIGDFEFWNTDAFISKLDLANGAMIWQTQFDAAPGIDRQCYPGDLKKQECMYKITEAPDGGLLVDGNTSNNQDDSYLAKLFPDCQSRQAFTTLPTSNFSYDASEDKYTLTSNYTLSSSATIHGRIVIPAGKQLTINGATVHFADSRQLDRPTGIIVAPQGKLLVNNNATLTSLSTCPNSMWDGIQVLGDPAAVQSPSIQGVAIIDHSTISKSRVFKFSIA